MKCRNIAFACFMGSLLGRRHARISWDVVVHGCDLRYVTFAVLMLSLLHRWHAVLGCTFVFADTSFGARMIWDVWLFLGSAFIKLHLLIRFWLSLHKRRLVSCAALIHRFPMVWHILPFELLLMFGLNWCYRILIGRKRRIINDLVIRHLVFWTIAFNMCDWRLESLIYFNGCTTLAGICFLLIRPFEWRLLLCGIFIAGS